MNLANKIIIIIFLSLLAIMLSCTNRRDPSPTLVESTNNEVEPVTQVTFIDTLVIHDTIKRSKVLTEYLYRDTIINLSDSNINTQFVIQPEILDSLSSQKIMEQALWLGYVEIPTNDYGGQPRLYNEKGLEYFPYLMLTYINRDFIPHSSQMLLQQYQDLQSNIAPLSKRALFHNDRKALESLEAYYKQVYPKGIAIYYKILLSYDGNGDLAEKFYRTLEPYFDETPQFRMAAREVLLRAALCDHNERAQELCDSLEFSLCDYKTL